MQTKNSRTWNWAISHEPFYTSRNSVIVRHDDMLLKFHKPQRFPKDHLRRYFGDSLAAREIRGYRLMRSIGLRTPQVVGMRILWNPLGDFDSISACKFIEDTVNFKTALVSSNTTQRRQIIDQFAADLQKMWNAWVLYRDLHLNNIVVDRNLSIFWVDPDVRRYVRYRSMRVASDCLIGRHLRINHRLLESYGMEKLCALILPKHRRQIDSNDMGSKTIEKTR